MSLPRALDRQLEAYEEAWKTHHHEAMRCRELEEELAVGIGIFDVLCRLDVHRREQVADGRLAPDPEADQRMLEAFRWWLRPYDRILAAIDHFAQQQYEVTGADEFRRCFEEAKEVVADWKPAVLQVSQSLPEGREPGPVSADTERSLTTAEMAALFDRLAPGGERDSEPLPFNPDDYPVR